MATGLRKYANLEQGTSSGAHTDSVTTLDFTTGAEPGFSLATGEYAVLAWGDFSDLTTVEIVHMVGPYTAGATSATIERGMEGTTALTHADAEEWRLVTVASDIETRMRGELAWARIDMAALQGITNNTWTKPTLSATDFDGDEFTFSDADDAVVVSTTGTYLVSAQGMWTGNSTGNRLIRITVNDVAVSFNAGIKGDGATGEGAQITRILELVAGDKVSFEVHQTSGVTLNLRENSGLVIHQIASDSAQTSFTGAKVSNTTTHPTTAGAWNKLGYDTVEFDTHEFWDDANDQYVIPAGQGGRYLAIVSLYAADGIRAVYHNGAGIAYAGLNATAGDEYGNVVAIVDAVAGDTISARVNPTGTFVGSSGTEYSHFSITKLGQAVQSDSLAEALLHVRDEKAAGTHAGAFTSGSWQTRDLNTVKRNQISGASLGSNQITLPAGEYYVEARAPAHAVNMNQMRLRDTTASSTVVVGTSNYSDAVSGNTSQALLSGSFTLSVESALELQHRCQATKATNGYGVAANFGEVEVYADLRIWKVG